MDIISFTPGLESQTITLLSELSWLTGNLTIDGNNSPVINGADVWEATGIKIYDVSDITVSGLRLTGFRYGIHMDWTISNIEIHDNIVITNTAYSGDLVTIAYNARTGSGPNSSNIKINGNTVENGRFGIFVNGSSFQIDDVMIKNNTVTGHSGISINTAYGPDSTVSNVTIENNTIQGSKNSHPGIIVITSHEGATTDNCMVNNVTISENTLKDTDGILVEVDSGENNQITGLVIEQNQVIDNYGEGINLANEASISNVIEAVVKNNVVVGCASEGIQCSGWVEAEVTNNLCGGNRDGMGFYGECQVLAANNLIYRNDVGINIEGPSVVKLYNNMIIENCLHGISSRFGGIPVLSFNDVWNNGAGNYFGLSPGTDDISFDPLFVDSAVGDFHLQIGSPCIDAGNPAPEYNDPDSTRNDIGVYGGPGASEFTKAIPNIFYYSGISGIDIENTRLSPSLESQLGGKFALLLSLTSSPCSISSARALSPSGQEFELYDDGTHGDMWADDGRYENLQMLATHPEEGCWLFYLDTIYGESDYQTLSLTQNSLAWTLFMSPSGGETVANLTPTLAWFEVSGADDGYNILIFDQEPQVYGPEGLVFITEIEDPEITVFDVPEGILEAGRTYYWAVMAIKESDNNCNSVCAGDIDRDGDVDGKDLAIFAGGGDLQINVKIFADNFARKNCQQETGSSDTTNQSMAMEYFNTP